MTLKLVWFLFAALGLGCCPVASATATEESQNLRQPVLASDTMAMPREKTESNPPLETLVADSSRSPAVDPPSEEQERANRDEEERQEKEARDKEAKDRAAKEKAEKEAREKEATQPDNE